MRTKNNLYLLFVYQILKADFRTPPIFMESLKKFEKHYGSKQNLGLEIFYEPFGFIQKVFGTRVAVLAEFFPVLGP